MILVDSSVWIDYFRGTNTPQADRLDALLGAPTEMKKPAATPAFVLTTVGGWAVAVP